MTAPAAVTDQLAALARATRDRLEEERLRREVDTLIERLEQPLIVAVGGREKAGKSTLTNCLLGVAIAQTAAGTCTKVVTWYRYSHHERVVLHRRDGSSKAFPLISGLLPDDDQFGAVEDIDRLEVYLSNSRLRNLTIVDTPGLESMRAGFSERTQHLLAFDASSSAAVAGADALIYVFQHVRRDDMLRLEDFTNAFPGTAVAAINTVGVLSRIDTLGGDDPDPWPAARRIAEKYSARLRAMVGDVIPVCGLLAQATACGRLTERHFLALRRIAGLDDMTRRLLFLSVERFRTTELAEVSTAERADLLSLLDLYGIRAATEALIDGIRSSTELDADLRSCSGIEALLGVIQRRFGDMAGPIKAAAVLSALERVTYADASVADRRVLTALRSDIEEIRLRPEMHVLEEMAAMKLIVEGSIDLPEPQIEDFLHVSATGTVAERLAVDDDLPDEDLRALVVSRATRWQAVENEATNRATQRLARTAKTSYLHLLAQMRSQPRPAVDAAITSSPGGAP